MRRQVRAFPGCEIEHEDIGILAGGMRLRVDKPLGVARKNQPRVAQLFCSVLREVPHMARGNIHELNLEAGAGFRFGDVGQPAAIGRPRGFLLGTVLRRRQVHHVAGFGRHQEDVPLLIAVVVGNVRDPGAIGRPGGRALALIADRQLCRPASGCGHQPDVVAPADVGDERDLPGIGRPRGSTDQARAVELLDGEGLHIRHVLTFELGRVGHSGRRSKRRLGECNETHKYYGDGQCDSHGL